MVRNVHERRLAVPAAAVGELLDSLGRQDDRLWPKHRWPAMRFDGPLERGASGGHGPIRYTVEEYVAGEMIRFRFVQPRGFHGTHSFEVIPQASDEAVLRHVLEMRTSGTARWTWPFVFRPLHDALVEDALDNAERQLGLSSRPRRWSARVRVLRALVQSAQRTRRALN
jgi:hypothetical protein